MKRLLSLCLAALSIGSALAAALPASGGTAAVIAESCTLTRAGLDTPSGDPNQRYWDPIVFPGEAGYPVDRVVFHSPTHWHNFFGNDGLTPASFTEPAHLLAETTSCTHPLDRSAYWFPSVIAYTRDSLQFRLDASRLDVEMKAAPGAEWPPLGLAVIERRARWDCGPGTPSSEVPRVCPGGVVRARLAFAKWWDGANLRLPDDAHVSYARDPGYPVRIPKLVVRVSYRFPRDTVRLSVNGVPLCATFDVNDPTCETGVPFREDPRSMHGDVLFAWIGDPR